LVDFNKLLGEESKHNETDPLLIFERLDKESGKEYLRPPQETVVSEWDKKFRNRRDVIVKLHTGQGKTLIGLLMLQSSLNESLGPAVFLCPNTYLVRQTIKEARAFGIKTVQFKEGTSKQPSKHPLEFLNSEAILVTTCKKMFNGKSVFGVSGGGWEAIQLGSIVMDDAHKCVDIIRESFSINVNRKNKDKSENRLYKELLDLFGETLYRQAPGTCIGIQEGSDSIMAVPFWTWHEKQHQVLQILNKYKESPELFFVWDLLKDKLKHSTCIFSGSRLQIAPRLAPVEMIPSFSNAKRRVLLSATLTEDAFLVRDLNIESNSVTETLTVKDVKYSGERMILIPTLVVPSITREIITDWLSRFTEKNGSFGVFSIVPSFKHASDWESHGAVRTDVRNLAQSIQELKDKVENETARQITILVNEYDGVDLPDNTCRILCLDSIPLYSSLIDGYVQEMRPNSAVIRRQLAQRIEQGMGRGIRGSSDWCIVIATGNKLTNFLSENAKREFLSNEAKMQIKIAEELADAMKGEGATLDIIENLVKQCIDRETGWKNYYRKRMEDVEINPLNKEYLNLAELERQAEIQYQDGQNEKALAIIQKIIDQTDDADKGWYFQLMATYLYPINPTDAMDKQVKAFSKNNRLNRPETGISYSKLANTTLDRETSIIEWIRKHDSHSSLIVDLMTILDNVAFNIHSESFEDGMEKLGKVLGFVSRRPEKESGSGPDNLWNIASKNFWIISCKNMVIGSRDSIHKKEAGQLNNDIAWFKQNYEDCQATPVFIHPAKILESNAFLSESSYVITEENLDKLKHNVQNFYNSLKGIPFEDISNDIIKQKLAEAHLDVFNLTKDHLERILSS